MGEPAGSALRFPTDTATGFTRASDDDKDERLHRLFWPCKSLPGQRGRFVLPSLTSEQIREVGEGTLSLGQLTISWIRQRYGFRYIETPGGKPNPQDRERCA